VPTCNSDIDGVGAAERSVYSELCGLLSQGVIERDEPDRMQIAKQVDLEARPDRVAKAAAQCPSDLCQDEIRQDD
jgi:hypothetical protein